MRLVEMCMALTMALPTQSVRSELVLFEDAFENGNTNGWIMDGADDTATAGTWEIGDPVGTVSGAEQSQPEDAFQGISCAFTAQNPGANLGFHDVDKGAVYMVSPFLDLAAFASVRLEYVRWYYLQNLDADLDDFFVVQARESEGSVWVDVEHLGDAAAVNSWTARSVLLEGFIGLTSTVQIRFGASDGVLAPIGNILEAAVDQVRVVAVGGCQNNGDCELDEYCSMMGECVLFGDGDFDADGDVDLVDYHACLGCVDEAVGQCSPCNLVGDEIVLVEDILALSQILSGPM